MDCLIGTKSGTEILLDYCSGALDPAKAMLIERHVESCADCRAVVGVQRELWETLDRWKAPAVSPEFNARLYGRIALENEMPAWRRWMHRLTQPALPHTLWKPAALAVACAVLAIGFLVHTPMAELTPSPSNATVQQADTVDIEQVANALEDLDMLTPPASGASKM